MKKLNEILLSELYKTSLKGAPIFVNPSSSDIKELSVSSKHKFIRFMAIAATKSLFVWEADKFLHGNAADLFRKERIVSPDFSTQNPDMCFTGTCKVEGLELYYQSSDELDYYVRQYQRVGSVRSADAHKMEGYFLKNALLLVKRYAFVDKWINGLDGDKNPFIKIYNTLRKK